MHILDRLARLARRLHLVWLAALLLLWWALKDVPWNDVGAVLERLHAGQILVLILLNFVVLVIFGLRLWVILRAEGHTVSLPALVRYWLAGFAFSYFTPGPQMGGGPLQIYLLHESQSVPLARAVTSVATSKMLEWLGNAIFLLFGMAILLQLRLIPERMQELAAATSLVLMLVPSAYLFVLWRGMRPMTAALARLSARWREGKRAQDLLQIIQTSEKQIATLSRQQPGVLLLGLGLTLLTWVGVAFETWLILRYLGSPLAALKTVAVIAVTQLAFLLPTPAGLGALEAGLVIIFRGLGYPAVIGISLALIMRARDILLGVLGLGVGGRWFLAQRHEPFPSVVAAVKEAFDQALERPDTEGEKQIDEVE